MLLDRQNKRGSSFNGGCRQGGAKWICFVIGAILLGCQVGPVPEEKTDEKVATCNRIVSLAPNLTEIAFALGLGDRVIGVTRFCKFPKAASKKKVVGGYIDPNYEILSALKPDLVLLLEYHKPLVGRLDALGLDYLVSTSENLSGLMASIESIGTRCGVEKRAESLRRSISEPVARISKRIGSRARPRVLVSVGRSMGSGSIKDIYAAGPGTLFDELIGAAGGVNAFEGEAANYARLTAEGVLELNPDVIIDLVVDLDANGVEIADVVAQWNTVDRTNAVRTGRIHVLANDYVVVPGPRIVLLLEQLARLFHPDAGWEEGRREPLD